MRYVIITPVYNEQQYITKTLESVVRQETLPLEWVIVNDNSTDDTENIVEKYVQSYPWIKLVSKLDENERKVGAKVVRVFYHGLDNLSVKEFDFLVKLDADLDLPLNYFSEVSNAFKSNPRIGICSGYCVIYRHCKWVEEKVARWHTMGAMKAYRYSCFNSIGGIEEVMGWDGIDDMTAMARGWETKQLQLAVKHLRPMDQASDPVDLKMRQGRSYYQRGYGLILTIIRTMSKFYISGSVLEIFILKGFIKAWIYKTPKSVDPDIARFIRKFQYQRIIKLRY